MSYEPPRGPGPYDPYRSPQPTPRRGLSTGWVLGIIFGVLALVIGVPILAMLVCCGGFFAFGTWGVSLLGTTLADQYQSHPAVVEHIGDT